MINVSVTSPPSTEPVSLAEAKLYLKVESGVTEDDALITTLIKAAREYCENWEGRKYITQTLTCYRDGFADKMVLPYAPVSAITSISYVASGGSQSEYTVLDSAYYKTNLSESPASVTLSYGYSWPATLSTPNAVKVVYVCGYGSSANVPQRVILAMLLLIGEWYENRSVGLLRETTMEAIKNILVDRVWW